MADDDRQRDDDGRADDPHGEATDTTDKAR